MMQPSATPKPIRVLITDDSSVMRAALSRMIESDRELQIVGYAVDGVEVLEQTKALDPDVITLDIKMPRMRGLEALTRIMSDTPRPVIMLSSLTRQDAQSTFDALDRGAFDFIAKPSANAANGIFDIRDELLAKIKSSVLRQQSLPTTPGHKIPAPLIPTAFAQIATRATVVAIGTSTGGPKALQEVLSMLPAQLPAGILVVQHTPVGFTAQFAERLNHLCKVGVHEVQGEEVIEPGTVYIAPAGLHMTAIRAGNQRWE
jgi:two-component system, chemotaxis family, protein-glutamate methylesterase/glutaminase